jgi:PhzF family phenazine biosynthesis protein
MILFMTDVPFYWLDVFTSEQFKGNPAAVCLMKTGLEDSLYQNIARELGLSETAFAEKVGESEYKLRWFTPENNFLEVKIPISSCFENKVLRSHTNNESILSTRVFITEKKGVYRCTIIR